jgi:hypothetical protein
MPKIYRNEYCVRCGLEMRVCKITFVCSDCPVHVANVIDPTCYFDHHTGEKIKTQK